MKNWFVIYTRPKQELKTSKQLSSMGITTYCPTVNLIKQYSDRKKRILKPILPSYIMVQLEDNERSKVFSSSGVVRYLFFLGKPAVVPPSEIELMQNHLHGVYKEIQIATLSLGDAYKIKSGPFSGISGRVVETNNTKVKLQLESLGMSITLKKREA